MESFPDPPRGRVRLMPRNSFVRNMWGDRETAERGFKRRQPKRGKQGEELQRGAVAVPWHVQSGTLHSSSNFCSKRTCTSAWCTLAWVYQHDTAGMSLVLLKVPSAKREFCLPMLLVWGSGSHSANCLQTIVGCPIHPSIHLSGAWSQVWGPGVCASAPPAGSTPAGAANPCCPPA